MRKNLAFSDQSGPIHCDGLESGVSQKCSQAWPGKINYMARHCPGLSFVNRVAKFRWQVSTGGARWDVSDNPGHSVRRTDAVRHAH